MNKVEAAVRMAVDEYNNTILGRHFSPHSTDGYSELRGIFYNSLRRALNWRVVSQRFMDEIPVYKLACRFRKDNTIEKFEIDVTLDKWGMSEELRAFLQELKACCNQTYLITKSYIDLSDIQNFKFITP